MWLGIYLLIFPGIAALRLDRCNVSALGMESGRIRDSQIKASTSFDQQSVGPQNSRIRTEKASGAWCPKNQINMKSYEFLQVSLERTYIISAIETQGRFGNGTGREFAKHYMIDYLRNGSQWVRYRNRTGHQLIDGNNDTLFAVIRALDPPIIASRIRLVPASRQTRTVCMRMELYGCPHTEGVLFYSIKPDGSKLGRFFDYRDITVEETDLYDQNDSKRGLGSLYDGLLADTSPYDDESKNGSWVGWNQGQTGGNVNLTFEFDTLRNFSSVEFAAFGEKMEAIDVIFSQDGTTYPLVSQISSLDQSANRTMRRFDLRLPLHRRTARKVRISFRFATEWFFLTEITFNSVLFNQTEGIIELANTEPSSHSEAVMDYTTLFCVGAAILVCLLLCLLCSCVYLNRRNQTEKESNIFEGESRAAMIVTTMGTNKMNSYPTSHTYLNHNHLIALGTDRTLSTNVSTKSDSSSSTKNSPPSWNDFHFPPPPETPENDAAYAELCATLPLLPSQTRMTTNKQSEARTLNRSPKKHKMYVDDSLHYATSNIFTAYGFENIPKMSSSRIALGEDLGEGKFTVVRQCFAPEMSPSAYKCAKERGNIHARRALLDELRVLSSCEHPHIIRLLAMDEEAGLLLEYMAYGDVRSLLKSDSRIGMNELLCICADIASALVYLEGKAITHGHLTPGNILVDERMRAKLAAPRGQSHHAQLRYSAPECILLNQWTNKSDMWSYAVTTWEVLQFCTKIPYEGLNNGELMENAEKMLAGQENSYPLKWPELVPLVFRKSLTNAVRADPLRRPDFAHIMSVLSKFHTSLTENR